jgi:cytidyltransferase-like protein
VLVWSKELDAFAEMIRARGHVVVSSGYYDPMHAGHASYLLAAARLGAIHVAIVNGDNALCRKRGKQPFMPASQRAVVVNAIRGVDYVVVWDEDTVDGLLMLLRPAVFAKGGDRTSEQNIPEWRTCRSIGIEVVTSVGGDKVESSSALLTRWVEAEYTA